MEGEFLIIVSFFRTGKVEASTNVQQGKFENLGYSNQLIIDNLPEVI
jgi:hypothetical protein